MGGRLVAFATETVYGVAALAADAAAMDRLRELKSRPDRPFTVHVGRPADAYRYVRDVPPVARRLIDKAWPGPVTMLLPTGGALADAASADRTLYDSLCHKDVIGLRCPRGVVAQAMLSAVESPVVVPSANLAGEPSPRTARQVLKALDGKIDLLIDSGPTSYGIDSTIISFAAAGWEIVRRGVYDEEAIRRMLAKTVLFVCTGNTCRSPIAAGLLRKLYAQRLGCRVGELARNGLEALSAGVMAADGEPATPEAVTAASAYGADISHHRSRRLTSELINAADLVLCMTDFHVEQAGRLVPAAVSKIERLIADRDVPDPMGGGSEAYRRTAETIEQALKERMDKGEL